MKWIKRIATIVLSLFILLIGAHLCYVYSMSPDEKYPQDSFLNSAIPKRALIITAHDDDAYSVAGTVTKLIGEGWEVSQVSLKRKENPENNERFYKIAKEEGLKEVTLLDLPFRKDSSPGAYLPTPYANFPNVFNVDTVYAALSDEIERFKPTVIFSLDDVIGGYGHPEHVLISQQVVKYCRANSGQPGFTVQRIYQAVYPPSMAEAVMVKATWINAKSNPYLLGKAAYNCNGMPPPDVAVNIYDNAKAKRRLMDGFSAHDKKNIAKASPYYHWYPYWIYFRIFDQEYFRVLSFTD